MVDVSRTKHGSRSCIEGKETLDLYIHNSGPLAFRSVRSVMHGAAIHCLIYAFISSTSFSILFDIQLSSIEVFVKRL